MRRVTFLALCLGLLAGCAGFPDGGSSGPAPLDPVRTTIAAGTASVRFSTDTAMGGTRVAMTGVGTVDLAHHRAALRFDHATPEIDRLDTVLIAGRVHVHAPGKAWRTLDAEQLPQADPLQVLALVADVPADQFEVLGGHRYGVSVGTTSIRLWLDDEGRIRRAETDVAAATLRSRTTLDLDHFGRTVHIEAP